MSDFQTVQMLRASNVIAEEEVEAGVEAFLDGSVAEPFVFRSGHRLNLVKAVRSHPGAQDFVGRSNVGTSLKRPFVRAAILQARPAKA